MTRNPIGKHYRSDFVDLMIQHLLQSVLCSKHQSHLISSAPSERVRAEIYNESENKDCEHVKCQDCLDFKSQILNLKNDTSESHKEN